MSRLRAWCARFGGLFGKERKDRELAEELDAHVQMHIEDNLRAGMSPEEARRQALIKLGGIEQAKESYRARRGIPWIETLLQDVRFGARMLRKNPGFTTVAVLTLALGIGANTAIFSLIDTVMLKMLPVQEPEELVSLLRSPNSDRKADPTFSNPVWEQIRDRQDIFSGIFAWSDSRFDLAQGGESHNVNGEFVSGEFFDTLGVRPAEGRLLIGSDDVRGCPGVAVLSYGFWQDHYGGARNAVGSMLSLNQHSFQVVGVAPPGFFGVRVGEQFDVAVPVCAEAIIPLAGEPNGTKFLDRPSAQWLEIIARPKPGIAPLEVNARLRTLSPGIFIATVSPAWRPEVQKDFLARTLLALPAGAGLSDLRQNYGQPLKVLMAFTGVVLLIACANIASLILVRMTSRRKEIAVRRALGASRPRLIRQLLTESILLSALGALLGILLARWGCALLVRFISTSQNHVFLQLSLDLPVLAFTAGIAVLTGLLFGLLPALGSTRVTLVSAMKGAQSEKTQGRSYLRSSRWIVASQVALSLVVLIVAGLLVRSFRNLLTLDLGFDRSNVLLIETTTPHPDLSPDQRAVLYRQILDRLNSLPGAISVGESLVTPISGYMWGGDFSLENGRGPSGDEANAYMNFVSPGYFATLRSPLLAGRNFDEQDAAGAQPVVIVNETMARRFFPGSQAVGQYLLTHDFMNDRRKMAPPLQVVGIVTDTKYESLREEPKSIVYFPIEQSKVLTDPPIFEIRTAAPPSSLARLAEQAIAEANKSISLDFRSLSSQVNDSLQRERLLATLSGFFAGLALLLAAIGLYGVLAYMVGQRTHEIGIRMALGAPRRAMLRMVILKGMELVLPGICIGVIWALALTRLLSSQLFAVRATDPLTFGEVTLLLTVVVLLACYVPARRATRVDPMVALRHE